MFESSTLASPQTSNQKQFATSFPEALKQDTTKKIEELFALFANNSEEVEVSFRDLVHWIKLGERGTHYLHAYPAKLLPQIAHFFLASRKLCPPNGTVLDPFGGTGTVALETLISGRNAAYVDANPLARLIASAKVQVVAIDACKKALHEVELAFRKSRKRTPPNVVNIEKWYSQKAILGLTRLSAAINSQKDEKIHTLLQVTLSAVARKVSNTDPRLSVPVYCEFTAQASRKKEDVWARFEEQFNSNLRRLIELEKLAPHYRDQSFTIVAHDARRVVEQSGGALKAGSVDLVITSPPYAGAQKYIRASSLSLGWLGIAGNGQLKSLENESIGREHLPRAESRTIPKTSLRDANKLISLVYEKNQKRAAICATYLNEMEKALYEISASLKKDGYLVLVIGNNMVCGHEFPSSDYLTQMILKMNFALRCSLIDKIRSRGLMTKRNRTASVILAERVLVFQKK